MRYAVNLVPDDNDTLRVEVPDVPIAHSFGDNVEDALRHGLDAIESAIMIYIDNRQPVPKPRAKGLHYVEIPALTVAKVGLHHEMLRQNLRKADLVRMLGWKPMQVDRLLDLRHGSRLDQLEQAFAALGKRLEIGVKDAA
ncbi:MAG TPA: type II toxin-antitoxin system HicB family antitoxin [Devosia sp.]